MYTCSLVDHNVIELWHGGIRQEFVAYGWSYPVFDQHQSNHKEHHADHRADDDQPNVAAAQLVRCIVEWERECCREVETLQERRVQRCRQRRVGYGRRRRVIICRLVRDERGRIVVTVQRQHEGRRAVILYCLFWIHRRY
jgi:hypothetical protein